MCMQTRWAFDLRNGSIRWQVVARSCLFFRRGEKSKTIRGSYYLVRVTLPFAAVKFEAKLKASLTYAP